MNIPNAADAEDPTQAQVDSRDFSGVLSVAFDGTGIATPSSAAGCQVTAQATPNMTLAVAAGTVAVLGAIATVVGGNVTITTADPTNPRFDLVTIDVNGNKVVITGTPAASPVFPNPGGNVVLAAVRVPAGATFINSQKIVDKRTKAVIPPTITINTQTASYTMVLADAGKVVEMNVATANVLTVPLNANVPFPIGTEISFAQLGAGQTTVAGATGVTLRSYNNSYRLAGQYAVGTFVKRGQDEWWVAGNVVP